jgi:hypothetical protein
MMYCHHVYPVFYSLFSIGTDVPSKVDAVIENLKEVELQILNGSSAISDKKAVLKEKTTVTRRREEICGNLLKRERKFFNRTLFNLFRQGRL